MIVTDLIPSKYLLPREMMSAPYSTVMVVNGASLKAFVFNFGQLAVMCMQSPKIDCLPPFLWL